MLFMWGFLQNKITERERERERGRERERKRERERRERSYISAIAFFCFSWGRILGKIYGEGYMKGLMIRS